MNTPNNTSTMKPIIDNSIYELTIPIRTIKPNKREKKKHQHKQKIEKKLQNKQIKKNNNHNGCCKLNCDKPLIVSNNPLFAVVQLNCGHKYHSVCASGIFINCKRQPTLPLICAVCKSPFSPKLLPDIHWPAFKAMKGGIHAAFTFKNDVLLPISAACESADEYFQQFENIRTSKRYSNMF